VPGISRKAVAQIDHGSSAVAGQPASPTDPRLRVRIAGPRAG
jgi:hypothetical protein